MCGEERETWEHTWERCREWREGRGSWQEALGCVLEEEREGEWWMREIKKARGEGKKGGLMGRSTDRERENE